MIFYQVWSELFDKIVDAQHGGYGPERKHKTDLDPTKVSYSCNDTVIKC